MKMFWTNMRRRIASFARKDDGVASIEIVMILPVMTLLFMIAFEGGRVSLNHVMLERGLDLTVRDVRIGKMLNPSHDDLKESICDYARIIPECRENLQLEMVNMNVRAWSNKLNAEPRCIDRAEDVQPAVQFTNGGNNELMVLQVCSLFDPKALRTGLGKVIPKKSGDAYALIASAAFVMEPFQ